MRGHEDVDREPALTGHFYLQITETTIEGKLTKLNMAMGKNLGKITEECMGDANYIARS